MKVVGLIIALIMLVACSSQQAKVPEQYKIAYRQLPPETVYSRLTWTHPPQPIPAKAQAKSPLLMPTIAFEVVNASLEEAIEALAQTIGYNWNFPKGLRAHSVSLKMVGTVEDILTEIERQAKVETELDHDKRLLKVL